MKTQFIPAKDCTFNRNFTSNDYYSNTWMMSQDINKWWYRATIGSGGRGKTYSGRKRALKGFKNDKRGFIWLRLTDQAVDNLLQNNAMGLFPIELKRKYKIEVKNKGNAIYFNDELAGYVASIQGYYKNKGQEIQLPDYRLSTTLKTNPEFSNFDIFADELIREAAERNTFDVKKAFQNQIENVVRRKKGIRVFIYANFLTEIRDIEELFDIKIVSGQFGIYRNQKTKTVIEYLEDSEAWKAKQQDTYAGVLNVDGGRFSNKADEDNKLIVYNHKLRGSTIAFNLKIGIHVYAVKRWQGSLVLAFFKGNENKQTTYCLRPEFMTTYLQTYNEEIRKTMNEMFNRGKLKFTSYSTYLEFLKHK